MFLPNSSRSRQVPAEIIEAGYRNLLSSFREISQVSQEFEQEFREKSRIVLFHKKEVILRYNQVCRYCLFMLRGLVKSTFVLDGVEKIVWFMTAGDVVIAVHSWYEQKPSEEQLTALKETICVAVSWEDIESLKQRHRDFMTLVLSLTEKYYTQAIQRTKWQQYSTDGKIRNLQQLYPKLMATVPATYLANYLGISRETFSRKRR